MVNYEYGKIYKLYSNQQNITYIGSTAMYYLSKRLAVHRGDYKQYLKSKSGYVTSFKILECEDYKIELLEKYPCANVDQLETRERYYIENNECVNKNIPTRTKAEWYEDNKDKIKEQKQKWYQDNKEHILEQVKEYKEANRERILEQKREYSKKYYEANEDKIKKYSNEYYKNNTDKIKARVNQVISCQCGCDIRRGDLSTHKKSKKHIRLMELVQNN